MGTYADKLFDVAQIGVLVWQDILSGTKGQNSSLHWPTH